jgi:hypothetical protein
LNFIILDINYIIQNMTDEVISSFSSLKIDGDKMLIIDLFNKNVKGVEIVLDTGKHCGKEGHWLEKKMGIKHNSKNEPDLYGYEMKKSSPKTSLGDYSASEYAFSAKTKREHINIYNNWTDDNKITRVEFIRYFGNPNPNKKNRYSWSGKCVPHYNTWNDNGQNLIISDNNDIVVLYSFSVDKREVKATFPSYLQKDNLMIAIWKSSKMKPHIDNKFNNKGFFICKKKENKYESICFGKPFNFEYFIECIKNNKIIFDSGMYEGNTRNYSHFRGSTFWDELATEVA